MTTVRTDLMTWPPLLPFRQPILAKYLSRDFVVPFFLSVAIHAYLVFLLGIMDTDRTAFEPTAPSIDTHLTVSLTTLDTASQNELDREAVSVEPDTGPPAESKAEAESIVESKGLEIPGFEVPDSKSFATDATPLIDLEAFSRIDWELGGMSELEFETDVTSIGLEIPRLEASDVKSLATDETSLIDLETVSRIDWEFGEISELEFETVVTSIGQGIPGLEVPDSKSLATDATPSIDLEAISRIAREGTWMHRIALEDTWTHCIEQEEGTWMHCIEQEGKWMSKSEVLLQKYEYSMFVMERNRATFPPDCRVAYAGMGIFGIPFLIRDAITGDGCKW